MGVNRAAPALAGMRLTPRLLQAVIEKANCYASIRNRPNRRVSSWLNYRQRDTRRMSILWV
jgi:hypothetical protein